MATLKLKGLKKVTRKLASGKKEIYWYAWISGPRLDGKPGSPEFFASYNRAIASRRTKTKETFRDLIQGFRDSADYKTQLSVASKREYARYLLLIENKFGTMPLEALKDPRVRGVFMKWRDGMADTPRKADYAWSVLARVLSLGEEPRHDHDQSL